MERVRRTAKMYANGKFVRSESGRVVRAGEVWGCNASRKDVRDAVAANVAAQEAWARTRATLRGMILYRLGEMLQQRSDLPGAEMAAKRAVWWAGWCDKLPMVWSGSSPVGGHLVVNVVEPVGVVASVIEANGGSIAEEIVDAAGAALAAGCAVTILVRSEHADAVQTLGEVLAVSDIPAGCVNVLTSNDPEAVLTLCGHGDVAMSEISGVEAWGVSRDAAREAGGEQMQRTAEDGGITSSPERALRMMDTKAVWHPVHV